MPKGIKPKVNEAREFLEIAKDFKDPKEIVREALSNSWDAGSTECSIKFSLKAIPNSKAKKIIVEIKDNGQGMGEEHSPAGPKEIEVFFNLGDSHKIMKDSIGTKGHGTKIYYRSNGILVDTWKNGVHLRAGTEMNPWETLKQGKVPTYYYDEITDEESIESGTHIVVDGFIAKQKDFSDIDNLIKYVRWSTVMGAFSDYFRPKSDDRSMKLKLQSTHMASSVEIDQGFEFPDEQTNLDEGTDNTCKIFGPETISCGRDEKGEEVAVEVIGALLGPAQRNFVPDTYQQMGLWLSKDYIMIERHNKVIEQSSTGQFNWAQFLVLVNCQKFDLTANRNSVRKDDVYDLALEGIKEFFKGMWSDEFTKSYFSKKKNEDTEKDQLKKEADENKKRANILASRDARINEYNARTNVSHDNLVNPIRKKPKNEAETALLLQSMISSNHPGIDFVIGDYNANYGVDMIIEQRNKGIPMIHWAEIVFSLDNLNAWPHPVESYHVVVCYEKGDVGEKFQIGDKTVKLVSLEEKGHYTLNVGKELIRVYVLEEILNASH